jgi:thiol:disulfide interchange protein
MHLDRDEFAVTYDPKQTTPERLIAAIRQAGYTAQVVAGKGLSLASETAPVDAPRGFPLLDEALSQAQRERKMMVLDFSAEWCAPCKRMEKTTFADAMVKELLARCVVVKIDTDQEQELARRFGVVGLPDIRFISPEGRVIHRLRGFQNAESFTAELIRLVHLIERRYWKDER